MPVDAFTPGRAACTASTSVRPEPWPSGQKQPPVQVKKKSLFSQGKPAEQRGRFQPQLSPWARGSVLAINCTTTGHAPSSALSGLQGDRVSIPTVG